MSIPPFHLAFPVIDLEATRHFFVDLIGCTTGRESERWIDFDCYGHQITGQLVDQPLAEVPTNRVDGKNVPAFHFGVILPWDQWHELADRLERANVEFLIEPYIRFAGKPGEQATMFLTDPSGNGLEFKAFKQEQAIFAT